MNIVLQTIVNFLYIPLLLYYIGQEEFGLFQLIGSLIAYLSLLDASFSSMVIRFYAKYLAEEDELSAENILAVSQRIYFILGLVILIIGGGGYYFIPSIFSDSMSRAEINEGLNIYLLLLMNFIFTMLGMVYQAVINARQKFLFLRGTSCLQTVLQPLLVLVLLQEYPNALGVAVATTILNVILIIWRWGYARYKLHICIKYHYWNKELFRGVGWFLLMQFIVAVVDMVFFKTNQVILGIINGTAAVATYAIASNIQNAYMMLSVSISGVFLPHVTEMVARGAKAEEISAFFIRIGRIQFFALGLVASGFIIFGQEFIKIWAGDEFAESYWIALLIMLPFTVDLIQNVGFTILQAMNRYGIRASVHTVVGILNIILAIPLGLKYGGIGCAAATGLCMFLGNGICMSYCYAHYLHLDILIFWRQIVKNVLIIMLLIGPVYMLNMEFATIGVIWFAIKIIVYTILYFIMVYSMCFNLYEKTVCLGWLKRHL